MIRSESPQQLHKSLPGVPRDKEESREEGRNTFHIYIDKNTESPAHAQPTRTANNETSPRLRRKKSIPEDERRLMGDYRHQGYGRKSTYAFSPQSLALETRRGDNVPPQRTSQDFPDRDVTSAKRRKISGRPTHEPPTSSPVHVLDSDDEAPSAERIQNRTVTRVPPDAFSLTAQRTQHSHPSNRESPFESFGQQSEFRKINERVDPRPAKKQRVTVFEKNVPKSELAVSKPVKPTQSSPIIVEDDQTQPDNGVTELSNGLARILQDIKRGPSRNENRDGPHGTVSPYFFNRHPEDTEPANAEAKTPSTNGKLKRPRPLNGERSPPPNSVRDRQTAAARAARAVKEADTYDSPDELQSNITVGSSSATVRPHVENSVSPEAAPETVRSPNDIQRTEFVRSRKPAVEPRAAKPKSRRKIEQPPTVWQLLVYRAGGPPLVEGDIQLHWYDDRRKGFVTVDGQAPDGEDYAACIDPAKLQSAVRGPPDCAQVQLRGSTASKVSYSRDLAFVRPSDLNEFMDFLEGATKGTLRKVARTTGDMNRVFAKILAHSNQNNDGIDAPVDDGEEIALLEQRVHNTTAKPNQLDVGKGTPPQPTKPKLISQMRVDAQDPKPSLSSARKTAGSARLNAVAADLTGYQRDVPDRAAVSRGSPVRRSSTRASSSRTVVKRQKSPSPSLIIDPEEEKYSLAHGLGPKWEQPVVFSLTGRKRAVVEFGDLERLDDGEFLNDNIISFYILLKEHEARQSGLSDRTVYSFNTYFYSQLAPKGQKGINYAAVQRWTAKDDLFNYDYIIVPVNEDAHWYVAIICNLPNISRVFHSGPKEDDVSSAKDPEVEELGSRVITATSSPVRPAKFDDADNDAQPQKNGVFEDAVSRMSIDSDNNNGPRGQIDVDTEPAVANTTGLPHEESAEWPDPTENEPPKASSPFRSEDAAEETKSAKRAKKSPRKKQKPVGKKYDPSDPVIIILDSLGVAHNKTARNLKDYIIEEGKAKRSLDIDIKDLEAMTARNIPLQDNFCDCGLFLLGYVEKFLQNPTEFVRKVLTRDMDAEKDWPEMDPRQMRHNIREILQQEYKKQADARLAEKEKRKAELRRRKKEREQLAKDAAAQPTSSQPAPDAPPTSQPAPEQPKAPEQIKASEQPKTPKAAPTPPPSKVHPEVVIYHTPIKPKARNDPVASEAKTPKPRQKPLPQAPETAAEQDLVGNLLATLNSQEDHEMLDQPQEPLAAQDQSVVEIPDSQPSPHGQVSPEASFKGQLKPAATPGDRKRTKRSRELT
ncbi:hypothetical protein H2201_006869 [Coniosporium apollinis]|uniref:Ubiquitin-like protease family profile domain-containing protein n=1 Tax=Coniosporium apollinis TaxID=61459 RepID=A0ABQ9NPV3_9PEZI|nr:hypothetical protein H2201_006869 [Coniosporium apollinis]